MKDDVLNFFKKICWLYLIKVWEKYKIIIYFPKPNKNTLRMKNRLKERISFIFCLSTIIVPTLVFVDNWH